VPIHNHKNPFLTVLDFRDRLKWAARESLGLALIEPEKQWQKGLNESFTANFATNACRWNGSGVGAEARVVIEEGSATTPFAHIQAFLNNMTPKHFCRQYEKNMNRGKSSRIEEGTRNFPTGQCPGNPSEKFKALAQFLDLTMTAKSLKF